MCGKIGHTVVRCYKHFDASFTSKEESASSATTDVWTSLGPLLRWVPGLTTRWALGLLDLCYTAPAGVERKDYGGIVLGYEDTHVRIHVKYS
jgi:hypothetical protein